MSIAIHDITSSISADIEISELLVLPFPAGKSMTADEYFDFCMANRDLKLEQLETGEIVVMSPTGGNRVIVMRKLRCNLESRAKKDGTGKAFDSSTEFRLPPGFRTFARCELGEADACQCAEPRRTTKVPAALSRICPGASIGNGSVDEPPNKACRIPEQRRTPGLDRRPPCQDGSCLPPEPGARDFAESRDGEWRSGLARLCLGDAGNLHGVESTVQFFFLAMKIGKFIYRHRPTSHRCMFLTASGPRRSSSCCR